MEYWFWKECQGRSIDEMHLAEYVELRSFDRDRCGPCRRLEGHPAADDPAISQPIDLEAGCACLEAPTTWAGRRFGATGIAQAKLAVVKDSHRCR